MTSSLSIRRQRESAVVAGAIGTLLVALAVMASLKEQQALVAALAGAAGVALWRQSAIGTWRAPALIFDLFAFAIFAIQRNDGLAFWQLVGPWADVARFNVTGAAIAYVIYIVGTLFALASRASRAAADRGGGADRYARSCSTCSSRSAPTGTWRKSPSSSCRAT